MSKLGDNFELGREETKLLRFIRAKRGVSIVSLTWKAGLKQHMKWQANCFFKCKEGHESAIIQYGATPFDALQNLARLIYK